MTLNKLITQITDLVIQKTVNHKIPTLIFISHIEKSVLLKNIVWKIKGGNQNENTFTCKDYETVAQIMENLVKIPLLVKETSDTEEIHKETENFINIMNNHRGFIIIVSKKLINQTSHQTII